MPEKTEKKEKKYLLRIKGKKKRKKNVPVICVLFGVIDDEIIPVRILFSVHIS